MNFPIKLSVSTHQQSSIHQTVQDSRCIRVQVGFLWMRTLPKRMQWLDGKSGHHNQNLSMNQSRTIHGRWNLQRRVHSTLSDTTMVIGVAVVLPILIIEARNANTSNKLGRKTRERFRDNRIPKTSGTGRSRCL